MGGLLRFPGGARQAGHQGRVSDPQQRPDAGLGVQSAPRRSSRTCRVRRAFNLAFDFEEENRVLSTASTSATTAISTAFPISWRPACPKARSWNCSRPLRDKVPPEVFTTPYTNPVNGNPENVRNNLREARELLKEAGFEIKDRKLVDTKGQPVSARDPVPGPGRRAHLAVLQAGARAARHRPPTFAPSTTCSTRTASAASTST